MLDNVAHKKNGTHPKNGKWKEFNKHAILVAEGTYVQDMKHGLWRQYYESGELIIEESYNHGVLHGRYSALYFNGQVMAEAPYVNGKREGYFYVYDETGKKIKTTLFANDIEVESTDKAQSHRSDN